MKKYYSHTIRAVLLSIIGLAVFCLPGESASLKEYLTQAETSNPKILEAYNLWQAARYKTKSVKALQDPMFSYGYFGDEIQTRVGPQEEKFGVAQKIPFPGKRHLMGKAQSVQADILREKYDAVKNEVLKEVKFVYYDLYWVDQAIQINEEQKEILEKLENVAQRRYESNMISQQDVIKTQLQLSSIIEKIVLLKQNRKALTAKFNTLVNQPIEEEVEMITELETQAFDASLDDVMTRTNDSRQELAAADLAVEKAAYEKSLAKMNLLPDFTLGAEFIEIGGGTTSQPNDGEDAWVAMVTVNVPLWFGKLKAQIDEKQAMLEAAEHNKESVADQTAYEVQDIYYKIQAYKDIVLLYETALIPQAEQAFDATQTGFETGKISFLDWLDTERTYLQTRLAYYKTITDYHKSIAFLERVMGSSL